MKRLGRLEITTRIGCSINCRYCPQEKLLKKYFENDKQRKSILSLEDFKHCLDKLPKGTRIDFSGMAEPWLNSECTEMVCYAAEQGFPIAIYTTLVGMSDWDFDRIKDLVFEEVVIHIPDNSGNSHIDITDDYMRLLIKVSNYKKEGINLVTGLSCHADVHQAIKNAVPEDAKLITELISRAGNVDSEYVESKCNNGKTVCINCEEDVNHNVLLPDGTIVLCCMDYGMKHVLGNLLKENYETIQNSEEAKKVRLGLAGYEEDVLCRTCTNARTMDELFDEFRLYQDWCKELLKEEKIKECELLIYKQCMESLQEQTEDLQAQVINLSDKKENLQKENGRTSQQCKGLIEQLDTYKTAQGNLQKQIRQQEKNYQDLQKENDRTSQQCKGLIEQLDTYKTAQENLQKQIRQQEKNHQELVDKKDFIENQYNQVRTRVGAIEHWRGYKFLAYINKDSGFEN